MEIKDTIIQGDTLTVLKTIPDESVDCIITSPPYYGLRDYGIEGQLGLEPTFEEYLERMLGITAELKRVLKKSGTLWWNHGDSFGGVKNGKTDQKIADYVKDSQKNLKKNLPNYEKCLMLQPYRLAQKMIDEQGWILRNIIIWHKPNCMPSSAKDRFTVDYEYLFFFSKNNKYYFESQYEPFASNDYDRARMARARTEYGGKWAQESGGAIKTQRAFVAGNKKGRNKRCVWRIPTRPFSAAHFAVYPPALIETPIKAGCPDDGIVLDPFMGAGTTAVVARSLGRSYIGIELNPDYIEIANRRLNDA